MTYDDCKYQCILNKKCEWFNWHQGNKRCYLQPNCYQKWSWYPSTIPNRGSRGWTASPRKCPPAGIGCSQDWIKIPVNEENQHEDLPLETNVLDVHQCQQYCRTYKACRFYTLNRKNGLCQLFANNIGFDYAWWYTSGPRDCTSMYMH